MFHVRSSCVPAAVTVTALAVAVAGCSGSGGTAAKMASQTSQDTSGPAYTATQLRSALLGTVNGAKPVSAVEAGAYGSLPGVKASRQSVTDVKITPAKCSSASATGLTSAEFNQVPATVATFRDGADGVSEVLLAPPASLMQAAITHHIPAGCSRYLAKVGGRTFTYEISQKPAPHIGDAASELNVRATGDASANIWTIIYRSNGLVGAVTLVGETATQSSAETLAQQAYAHAQKILA